MKPPEKKPLINFSSRQNETTGLIRRGSQKKKIEPVKFFQSFKFRFRFSLGNINLKQIQNIYQKYMN